MTNWLKQILDPSNTTTTVFAGDALNYLIDYFKDVNHASGDPTMIAKVSTETRYASGKLSLWDSDKSNIISFTTPNFTEDKTISIPTTLGTTGVLLLESNAASITNKTIDFNSNNIVNLPLASFSVGGVAQFNGTGSQTVFNIAHGGSGTPTIFFADANTTDALGNKVLTANATNIVVTYATPPPSGTNNVKLVWAAGSTTGSGVDVLLNKTIGDRLGFQKVTTPGDPALEECAIYWKTIDTNNNGLFIKGKKNGVIVEGQLW